jgi:hypothetical protein
MVVDATPMRPALGSMDNCARSQNLLTEYAIIEILVPNWWDRARYFRLCCSKRMIANVC